MMGVGSLMSSSRGSGEGGNGVSLPAWLSTIATAAGSTPTMAVYFDQDKAWLSGAEVTVASLLACAANSSDRYYQNADGTLSTFAANTLRYGTNGLLVEGARTNLHRHSSISGSVGSYSTAQGALTANATTAPDGTTTAAVFIPTAVSNQHVFYLTAGLTSTAATYTFSVYAKPNGYTNFQLDANADGLQFAQFTLSGAGSVSNVQAGCSATITALANGWYFCALTALQSARVINPILYALGNGSSRVNTANGVSGYYFWGLQYELGAFATSYIPTTTTSATRAADIVTFSDLTWFDGAGQSIHAEWQARNLNNAKVWAFDAANDVLLDEQTGMSARIADAGASFALTVGNTVSSASATKAAARMATNDIALCMIGGSVATDTTATQPGTLSASRLGVDLSGANALNGYIKRIAAFKSVLIGNSNLQAMTA